MNIEPLIETNRWLDNRLRVALMLLKAARTPLERKCVRAAIVELKARHLQLDRDMARAMEGMKG